MRGIRHNQAKRSLLRSSLCQAASAFLAHQDRDEIEVLFIFLSERYERKPVLISTNLVFSEWECIFKNPMSTMATIDRVIHHCVILDLMALDSYRAYQTTQRQSHQQEEATIDTNK